MKKAFILGAWLVLFTTSAFCQYRDTNWGDSATIVNMFKELKRTTEFDIGGEKHLALFENKVILGQKSAFVYFFNSKESLEGIVYQLDFNAETMELLINKMNSPLYTLEKMQAGSYSDKVKQGLEKVLEKNTKNGRYEWVLFDDTKVYDLGNEALLDSFFKEEEKSEDEVNLFSKNPSEYTEKCAAYQFAYGNKTTVYVYANIFPGKIGVVYKEREDNF